jgi:CDP-diacylglycerol pyrophosphatase
MENDSHLQEQSGTRATPPELDPSARAGSIRICSRAAGVIELRKWRIRVLWSLIGTSLLWGASASGENRNALRDIVQQQCVVHWLRQHSASPCERIYLPAPPHQREGFAVLADRKGGAHFLLIPTKTIAGMESPALFEPDTPNYFAAAWRARDRIAARIGHPVPRSCIGLALNPQRHRTQDQLHIHIECLRADIFKALHAAAHQVTSTWSTLALAGSDYQALRIMGEELDQVDPFKLLADTFPAAKSPSADYTLVVAGINFAEGPGFILLARAGAAGELLLDSSCAAARRL